MKCLNCGKNFDNRKVGTIGYFGSRKSFKFYCSNRCASYLSTLDRLSRLDGRWGFAPAQTKRWKKKAAKTLKKVIHDDKYDLIDIPRYALLGNAQYRPNENISKGQYFKYRLRMNTLG